MSLALASKLKLAGYYRFTIAGIFSSSLSSADDGFGSYSVSIITEPSQGPFRIGQDVQFMCQVDPTPPDPVTYQWRIVERSYEGSTSPQQNISTFYYYYDYTLRYCYYYCQASVNQTLLGSASRVVEVQGICCSYYNFYSFKYLNRHSEYR